MHKICRLCKNPVFAITRPTITTNPVSFYPERIGPLRGVICDKSVGACCNTSTASVMKIYTTRINVYTAREYFVCTVHTYYTTISRTWVGKVICPNAICQLTGRRLVKSPMCYQATNVVRCRQGPPCQCITVYGRHAGGPAAGQRGRVRANIHSVIAQDSNVLGVQELCAGNEQDVTLCRNGAVNRHGVRSRARGKDQVVFIGHARYGDGRDKRVYDWVWNFKAVLRAPRRVATDVVAQNRLRGFVVGQGARDGVLDAKCAL